MFFKCPQCKHLHTDGEWEIIRGQYYDYYNRDNAKHTGDCITMDGKDLVASKWGGFFIGRVRCEICDCVFDIGVENKRYKKIILTPADLVMERMLEVK